MRVLVFGDSIAYGAWDSAGGWVERLKSYAHQKTINSPTEYKVQVLNLGVGGHSSEDILSRLEAEITSRTSKSWPFVFIFYFGTNDARTYDGVEQNSLENYLENTENIINIAKQYSDRLLFIRPIPVGTDGVDLRGAVYSNQKIEYYGEKQLKLLERLGVASLDLWNDFVANKDSFFCFDGLHPNDNGHDYIFKNVKEKIAEMYKI